MQDPIQLIDEAAVVDGLSVGQSPSGSIQKMNPTDEVKLLFNRKKPFYNVQQEKPHHRVMLEMAAKGMNVKEIAHATGYTPVCVNNILRQSHSQESLVEEIRRQHGTDERVVQVIKDNVLAAVETLASIVRDDKAKGSDRIAAAEKLLERRYGKANQPINRGTDVDLNALPDSELAKMLQFGNS